MSERKGSPKDSELLEALLNVFHARAPLISCPLQFCLLSCAQAVNSAF